MRRHGRETNHRHRDPCLSNRPTAAAAGYSVRLEWSQWMNGASDCGYCQGISHHHLIARFDGDIDKPDVFLSSLRLFQEDVSRCGRRKCLDMRSDGGRCSRWLHLNSYRRRRRTWLLILLSTGYGSIYPTIRYEWIGLSSRLSRETNKTLFYLSVLAISLGRGQSFCWSCLSQSAWIGSRWSAGTHLRPLSVWTLGSLETVSPSATSVCFQNDRATLSSPLHAMNEKWQNKKAKTAK